MAIKATLLAMASAAMAISLGDRDFQEFRCGAPEPAEDVISAHQAFAQAEAVSHPLDARASVNVDTYVHIVVSSQSEDISDSTIAEQMQVLNSAYADSGFSFTLKDTDRTFNAKWARDGDEMAMKRELRKGDYAALNLYFLSDLGSNLGYCYFPTNASPGSSTFIRDGCSILASSVPGGSAAPYNEGGTATHEVGHWMGLFHTFQGGCYGAGDEVDDTPAQYSPSSGCPTGRDSCTSVPGLDPIHNYMDYSVDACYEEFTPGQARRMMSFFNRYRA